MKMVDIGPFCPGLSKIYILNRVDSQGIIHKALYTSLTKQEHDYIGLMYQAGFKVGQYCDLKKVLGELETPIIGMEMEDIFSAIIYAL